MTSEPKAVVSRGMESRDTRVAAATRLLAENPRLAGVRAVGVVLAECTVGFA